MPLYVLPSPNDDLLTVLVPAPEGVPPFSPLYPMAVVFVRVVWDDPWAPEPVPVGVEVVAEDGPGVVTVTLRLDGTLGAVAHPGRVDGG